MNELIDKIKLEIAKADVLKRLIIANVGVFVLMLIINFFQRLFQVDINYISFFALSADGIEFITKPWTLFTYAFLHGGFMHIIFNMVLLYMAGQIFLQYFSAKQFFSLYVLGVIGGGLLFLISINLFPVFEHSPVYYRIVGASAGVMTILIAIAFYVPNYSIRLFLLGNVKLWHLAAFFVLLDFINFQSDGNEGGHLSHFGGAIVGYIFVARLKKGKDITIFTSNITDRIVNFFKPKSTPFKKVYKNDVPRSDYDFNKSKKEEEEIIDQILAKISKSGYESLTAKEKEILFRSSKK